MMGYCKVDRCRHNLFHITQDHKCGKCKKYGHGRIECDNPTKIFNLMTESLGVIIPNQFKCSIIDCQYRHCHTIEGHCCAICNRIGHSESECLKLIIYDLICPICRTNNLIKSTQKLITGIDVLCCICLVNPVRIYNPVCGHVCICLHCLIKLSATNTSDTLSSIDSENSSNSSETDDDSDISSLSSLDINIGLSPLD